MSLTTSTGGLGCIIVDGPMTLSEERGHYIVIRHPFCRDHMPTVEHQTWDEAMREAERLAAKHPAYVFRVYRSTSEAAAQVTITTRETT